MTWIDVSVLILTAICGFTPIWFTAKFKRALRNLSSRSQPDRRAVLPSVSVILPCKGIDPNFGRNIFSIARQDYPKLEIIFSVATVDEPAHEVIMHTMVQLKSAGNRCHLVVAGIKSNRSQKLTNQLEAIKKASNEVLVFLDSDIHLDPEFLKRLVRPLAEPNVGVSTGYRWYHPKVPNLGTMLQSTWNAGAYPFLTDSKNNFAWGGAMAITRETFVSAKIASVWENSLSDDLSIATAVRRIGLIVRFVPECVALTLEHVTLSEAVEFTNRQSLISRVYLPSLWWSAAIGHGLPNVLVGYGLIRFAQWIASGASWTDFIGMGCLSIVALQMLNAVWLFSSLEVLLPTIQTELKSLRSRYVFTTPLTSILTLINTVHAAGTRRITWRGITYEMVSPTETRVLTTNPRNDEGVQ